MKIRGIKVIFSFLLIMTGVSFLLTACENKTPRPAKPAKGNPKPDTDNKPKPNPDPIDKEITCQQRWDELVQFFPKGFATVYQESQSMKVKDETTVLTQTITEKITLDNTGSQVVWEKNVSTLSPEKGNSSSKLTIEKDNYINLCSKGFNINYTDRPFGKKAASQKNGVLKFNDIEFEVSYEIYDYSKSNTPIDKETLEIWIGAKDPYKGLLFNSKRVSFKILKDNITEITISKDLVNFKIPSKE